MLRSKFSLLLATMALLSACATSTVSKPNKTTEFEPHASFLVFGDSGNIESDPAKSALMPVAAAMKAECAKRDCDFGMMAGDNIYEDGADGLPDRTADRERFRKAFEMPYGGFLNQNPDFRIYMALGNHDWRTSRAGAFAQMDYAKTHPPLFMDGPIYKVTPDGAEGLVELFVIDTEILLADHEIDEYDIGDNGVPFKTGDKGRGGKSTAIPQTNLEKTQINWLENALKTSQAPWKIVLAHHPLWESKGTKHEQAVALRELLRPTVCRYADGYMSGHQHTLEIHADNCSDVEAAKRDAPLVHLVSGAAGKSRSINSDYLKWQNNAFSSLATHWTKGDVWGFMRGEVTPSEMTITVYSAQEGETKSKKFVPVKQQTFTKTRR